MSPLRDSLNEHREEHQPVLLDKVVLEQRPDQG
jgi:hypothetical protein